MSSVRLGAAQFVAFGQEQESVVTVRGDHSGIDAVALIESLEKQYREGIDALKKKEYSSARRIFQGILSRPHSDIDNLNSNLYNNAQLIKYLSLKSLGTASFSDGFKENALDCFLKAAKMFPDRDVMLWMKLGDLSMDSDICKLGLARYAYDQGLVISGGKDWLFIDRLIDCTFLLKDWIALKRLVSNALKLDKGYLKGLYLLKKLSEILGDALPEGFLHVDENTEAKMNDRYMAMTQKVDSALENALYDSHGVEKLEIPLPAHDCRFFSNLMDELEHYSFLNEEKMAPNSYEKSVKFIHFRKITNPNEMQSFKKKRSVDENDNEEALPKKVRRLDDDDLADMISDESDDLFEASRLSEAIELSSAIESVLSEFISDCFCKNIEFQKDRFMNLICEKSSSFPNSEVQEESLPCNELYERLLNFHGTYHQLCGFLLRYSAFNPELFRFGLLSKHVDILKLSVPHTLNSLFTPERLLSAELRLDIYLKMYSSSDCHLVGEKCKELGAELDLLSIYYDQCPPKGLSLNVRLFYCIGIYSFTIGNFIHARSSFQMITRFFLEDGNDIISQVKTPYSVSEHYYIDHESVTKKIRQSELAISISRILSAHRKNDFELSSEIARKILLDPLIINTFASLQKSRFDEFFSLARTISKKAGDLQLSILACLRALQILHASLDQISFNNDFKSTCQSVTEKCRDLASVLPSPSIHAGLLDSIGFDEDLFCNLFTDFISFSCLDSDDSSLELYGIIIRCLCTLVQKYQPDNHFKSLIHSHSLLSIRGICCFDGGYILKQLLSTFFHTDKSGSDYFLIFLQCIRCLYGFDLITDDSKEANECSAISKKKEILSIELESKNFVISVLNVFANNYEFKGALSNSKVSNQYFKILSFMYVPMMQDIRKKPFFVGSFYDSDSISNFITSMKPLERKYSEEFKDYCILHRNLLRKELAVNHFQSEYRFRLDSIDAKEAFSRLDFLESFSVHLNPHDAKTWIYYSFRTLHKNNLLRFTTEDILSHISVLISKAQKNSTFSPNSFSSEILNYFEPSMCAFTIFEFIFKKDFFNNLYDVVDSETIKYALEVYVLLAIRLYELKKVSRLFLVFLEHRFQKTILLDDGCIGPRLISCLRYSKSANENWFRCLMNGIVSLKFKESCEISALDFFKRAFTYRNKHSEPTFFLASFLFSVLSRDKTFFDSIDFSECVDLFSKFSVNSNEFEFENQAIGLLFSALHEISAEDGSFLFPDLLLAYIISNYGSFKKINEQNEDTFASIMSSLRTIITNPLKVWGSIDLESPSGKARYLVSKESCYQFITSDSVRIAFSLLIRLEDIRELKDLIFECSAVMKSIKSSSKTIPYECYVILDGIISSIFFMKERLLGNCPFEHELHEFFAFLCSKCWDIFLEIFEKYNTLIPEAVIVPFKILSKDLDIRDESATGKNNGASEQDLVKENSSAVIECEGIMDLSSNSNCVSQEILEPNSDLKTLAANSHGSSIKEFMDAINWIEEVNSLHIRMYTRTRRKIPKKHPFSLEILSTCRKYYDTVIDIVDQEENLPFSNDINKFTAPSNNIYQFGSFLETPPHFLRFWL